MSDLSNHHSTDVCVVGGGPAGSTIARRLTAFGYEVCLLDDGGTAGSRIGVCLPPNIIPILEQLDVRERIESADFVRPTGTVVRWGRSNEALYKPYPAPGITVDRADFDALLLSVAREAGVLVIQPARAIRTERNSDGFWYVTIRCAAKQYILRARFLVDASGRSGIMGSRRQRTSPATMALYSYWSSGLSGGEPRIEACDTHWVWGARLPHGSSAVVAVFLDPNAVNPAGSGWVKSEYKRRLSETSLFRGLLHSNLASPVQACNASASHVAPPIGDGWIRVGDAATCLDPLSSQGVQRAMVGALQGAVVVNTMLQLPDRNAAALEFYRERQSETVKRNQVIASAYYREQADACPTLFWRRYSESSPIGEVSASAEARVDIPVATQPLRLCPKARFRATPVLTGDLIDERLSLDHPALDSPIAFLGPVHVNVSTMSLHGANKRTVQNH